MPSNLEGSEAGSIGQRASVADRESSYTGHRFEPAPVPSRSATHAPSEWDLLLIALAVLATRLAVVVVTSAYARWSLGTVANLADGPSYLRVAANMLDPSAVVAHLDRRVFVGYPALIAAVGLTHVPLPIVALAVTWVGSAVAAVYSAALFEDRRVGWAMVFFPPSYLLYSTLAMSEASMLACVTVGLFYAVRRDRPILGGLALGYAGVIRPMACFAVLGAIAALVNRWRLERRQMQHVRKLLPTARVGFGEAGLRPVIAVSATAGGVVLAALLAIHWWRGSALESFRIYATDADTFAGHLLALPFASLITTPFRRSVPWWRVGYVWSYVPLILVGCVLAARRLRSERGSDRYDLVVLSATWLFGSTAFTLCTGSVWGFYYFDRHVLAALPPLLWTYRDVYPRRLVWWVVLGVFCFVVACFGVLSEVT